MNEFYLDILNVLLTERGFRLSIPIVDYISFGDDETYIFRNTQERVWFLLPKKGGFTVHLEKHDEGKNYNNHFEDLTSALEFLDNL